MCLYTEEGGCGFGGFEEGGSVYALVGADGDICEGDFVCVEPGLAWWYCSHACVSLMGTSIVTARLHPVGYCRNVGTRSEQRPGILRQVASFSVPVTGPG